MICKFFGDDEEEPEGPPRWTRRKNAKAFTPWRSASASVSFVTGGSPFCFLYAGERSALTADFPANQPASVEMESCEMSGILGRTFKIVKAFPI